ncbi:MAG: hypothetical protein ACTS73_05915 [Arsenophonus sp. NEOnobi-MAG3]
MSDEILEEFNAKCVSRFLEAIIDEECIFFAWMELNDMKSLPASIKLVTIA